VNVAAPNIFIMPKQFFAFWRGGHAGSFCYTIARNPEQWRHNLSLENELCQITAIIRAAGDELA